MKKPLMIAHEWFFDLYIGALERGRYRAHALANRLTTT